MNVPPVVYFFKYHNLWSNPWKEGVMGPGVDGHVDVVYITAKCYVGHRLVPTLSKAPYSNLLYAAGLSEKYCEPSVTSDGYSAKKSL